MFKEVDPKQDFIALEHEVIDFWETEKIVEKYLKKNNSSKKRWSFLDGPITANNKMGVHHAWGRTLKDLWQRFYTMRGYKQRYQNGFDCQGLWVEVEVEKELGFKNKRDIEKFGIDKFVNKCKERVEKYSKIQTDQSKRLAEWMDWDNSYYTMSDENNYTIWHFLKVCYENGWIYEGTDSVAWCPRCGTAISQHEMLTEEYKEITHDSIYFTLPIIEGKFKDHYLLIWTTTPWTIPANVAVAIDKNKQYTIIEESGKKLILLESRTGKVFGKKVESIKKIKGSELVGVKYIAPFFELTNIKNTFLNAKYSYQVIATDDMILPVSENEGTGLVHIAPGAGAEDFRLSKKYNLPIVKVIDEEAKYIDGMDKFSGKNAKENPDLIFDFLKNKENGRYFYKIVPYKHRYPTCWRCKTELVWRNVDEWYIAMDKKSKKQNSKNKKDKTFRQRMIEVAKKINWIPSWGLDRELDWLNNMHDWLISKKRYWGLALPIWKCVDCGHYVVIGSKDELNKKAQKGWNKFNGHSPHRPWIDDIELKCEKCGNSAKRIKDVGNPWLDAGIVPFSTYVDPKTKKVSYLDDKKYWKEWFPADFITECFPGQFKNWFYALIAMSTALENTNPYKTLLGHALVKDEHGEEMHKSKGNAIWFDEAAEKIGVDVTRWVYASQNTVQNLNFGYTPAKEVLRKFILTLWNTYSFFVTYANADKWTIDNKSNILYNKRPLLDKWVISRLNETIKQVEISLKDYNSFKATQVIETFVRDLSTWYLRLNRKRRDDAFYQTMYEVLLNLTYIISPFIPHISEQVYQNLRTENLPKSVHLSNWPQINKKEIDEKLLDEMVKIRQIVEIAHSIRRDNSIKVRQPLSKLQISKVKLEHKELLAIVEQEVNVKKAEIVDNIDKGEKIVKKTEYHIDIALDMTITEKLKNEGILREILRQIQFLRKKAGLKANDLMNLYWDTDCEYIVKIINDNVEDIKKNTLISKMYNKKTEVKKIEKNVAINKDKLYLAIN